MRGQNAEQHSGEGDNQVPRRIEAGGEPEDGQHHEPDQEQCVKDVGC